jgi:dihydrofolate reductase
MSEMLSKRTPLLLSRKMFEYLEIYFAGYLENPENVTLNAYRKYFYL